MFFESESEEVHMKKRILKTLVGAASLSLLLSACNFMPGMNNNKSSEEPFVPVENKNGSGLLTGYGRPSNDYGNEGDLYLDLSTYMLYIKSANGWQENGSLKGEDGKDGQDGQDGRDGQDGHDGKDGKDGKDGQDGQDGQNAIVDESGLTFFAINDYEYAVGVGSAQFYEGEITIPSVFNEKPVTAISENGFKDSSLRSVIIPEGVTSIGAHAFDGCDNLRTVSLPSTVNMIGERAFVNCRRLNSISIERVTNIGDWAFAGCTSLQSVRFSANLYNIGQGAFYDCSALSSVTYLASKDNWPNISAGQYWFVGTNVTTITCNDGSFNINLYNEEVLESLDNSYHIVGGYDYDNWEPNENNKMSAASIKQIYDIDRQLGSILSEKDIDHLYMRQIQVGQYPLEWTSKTFYKNKAREVSGEYTFRVSQSTYNMESHVYNENKYVPDAGNFSGTNRVEALTDNIFIPAYQSELDENGFNWNNSPVLNVRPGSYIFVMAEYKNANYWYGGAGYGFGLIVVNGGDMIINDPLEEDIDPNDPDKTYQGVYLNEDGTEFARFSANTLAELASYNKHIPEKAAVESTQYGFVEWELVSNIDGVVTFKPKFDACTRGLIFNGSAVDQYTGMTKDVEIPSMWMGQKITSIASRAFQSTDVESVTIPNTITRIDDQAFGACKKLESIEIPDSVTSMSSSIFSDCTALKTVKLSNNITSIPSNLFNNCTSLKTVDIPRKVTSIGYQAFRYCTNLKSIEIPNAVRSIEGWTFHNCQSLSSIVIPDSVTSIGDYAFYECRSLTSVTLGNSLQSIYNNAFYYCSNLTSITLPDSVTYVGSNAFQYCDKLVIYMSLEYKPKSFEQNWNGNATVIYGYIDTITVGGYTYTLSSREDHKYAHLIEFDVDTVVDFSVPESVMGYQVVGINTSLFRNNSKIETVTLPNTITEIGSEMFYNCYNLREIIIPEGVETIGNNAFYNCSSLESVELPDSVRTINYQAFYGCRAMASFRMSNNIEYVGENVFGDCQMLTFNYYENGRYIGNDDNPYLVFLGYNGRVDIIHEDCRVIRDGWNGNSWSEDNLLTIGDNVICIGYAAFSYRQIRSVVIGHNVKEIRNEAFYENNRLTTVFYKGTEDEWNDIKINTSGNNMLLAAKRYYYSEEEPTESGNFWHYVDGVPTAW